MAQKTYTGTFNLHTLQPAIEAADSSAKLFKRAGPFEAATAIVVDARVFTQIDRVVAAHDPNIKSQAQNDLASGVTKLQGLGFTDGELAALGFVKIPSRGVVVSGPAAACADKGIKIKVSRIRVVLSRQSDNGVRI